MTRQNAMLATKSNIFVLLAVFSGLDYLRVPILAALAKIIQHYSGFITHQTIQLACYSIKRLSIT